MTDTAVSLALHPERLLPAEPGVRAIARRLYEVVRDLPVISPHGHVDPRALLDDEPFRDPASLFVTPDHYVTRLLHASGVPLDALGVGQGPLSEDAARQVWRSLCGHWNVFAGTPARYWLEAELADIFDVTVRPSARDSLVLRAAVSHRETAPGAEERVIAHIRAQLPNTLGSFQDGRLASSALMYPFAMYLGGARARVGGLASVATAPWARRRGHVAGLLRAWCARLRRGGVRARTVTLQVRLADRFGDLGMIGVVICHPSKIDDAAWEIDTWLMSCRVLGRKGEEAIPIGRLPDFHDPDADPR